jgi:hypothetical protein
MAKKKEIYFGKGFKRIYFVASAIWILAWVRLFFEDASRPFETTGAFIVGMVWILLPIPLYYVLLWFIKGFKK